MWVWDAVLSSLVADNGSNLQLVKAVVCAGLYPNIIVVDGPPTQTGEPKLTTRHGDVFLHPCTVNFGKKVLPSKFLMYHEKVKTTKVYVRDCRCVNHGRRRCFSRSPTSNRVVPGALMHCSMVV
jgi:ATP-dependent RNA helicase DHX36